MAKILVACGIADGHVNPFLPIVAHLLRMGHNIIWIGGRAYKNKIESTGAKFYPAPIDYDPNGKTWYEFRPKLNKLKGINQIKFWVANEFYGSANSYMKIIDTIRTSFEPDIYLSDPAIYGMYFKAELSKKPIINIHVIPLPFTSIDHAPFGMGLQPKNGHFGRLRNKVLNTLLFTFVFRGLKKYSNQFRKELGLQPYRHIFNGFLESATKVLTVTVPGFDYERSDMPDNIEYVGPIFLNANEEFARPDWWSELKDNRPIVLVNQGTIATDISELILPTIEALGNQNYFLIAVPVKQEPEDLPDNVKVAKFIPFAHLLPHVDVLVTNGGFGATHMALAHGIPLVTSGGSEDKMEVSARVEYSGCGINLRKLRPTPKKIKTAVDEVLGNTKYKRAAELLQKEIANYNPLELVAKEIDSLT